MTPHSAFLRACALDVMVRKPGNVSLASPGHRMVAQQFLDSAAAAAGPLLAAGAPVGARIEGAVHASWAAAGCNTNLGIVLLCAPLAAAAERPGPPEAAIAAVLAALDEADAQAAFRAIVRANPGGLGDAPQGDVKHAPPLGLVAAMTLAAARDTIARQYANGFADVLQAARVALAEGLDLEAAAPDASVQRVFLGWLSSFPDSHIVRKHGEGVAQNVMSAAQGWRAVPSPAEDPGFAAWDESLKALGVNPGTSADLTVATLFACALFPLWHGK